jgi:hypothetical protein
VQGSLQPAQEASLSNRALIYSTSTNNMTKRKAKKGKEKKKKPLQESKDRIHHRHLYSFDDVVGVGVSHWFYVLSLRVSKKQA